MFDGPDFTRCGEPIDWEGATLDTRFADAAQRAFGLAGFDVELCRWSVDDPLHAQYAQWWESQRILLRRALILSPDAAEWTFVVTRRTDRHDGFVKCYLRIESAS